MAASQKIALSFLISILLFGGFTILAYTGLFDLLETRFYNQAITSSIIRGKAQKTEIIDRFLTEKQAHFSEALNAPAVRRTFLYNQDIEDILTRERIFRSLHESSDGIQWVRLIDSGGTRIHFSTYAPDILRFDGEIPVFANYNEPFLPYETIAVESGQAPRIIFDETASRILFSFPFYDPHDFYMGTALYSLSVNAIANLLTNERKLRFGEYISIISNPNGLLFGVTTAGEPPLPSQISAIWREGGERTARLFSPLSQDYMIIFSEKTSQGVFVGRIVNEEIFSLPQVMQIVFLITVFVTLFLIVFLLFNTRQDPVAVVQNRLKQLQVSLVEQFYELKGEADWTRWMRDIDMRRNEIISQLKKGINFNSATESSNLDALINESWDELLVILGGRKEEGIDEEKLQAVLKRVLGDFTKNQFQHSSNTAGGAAPEAARINKPSLLMKATAIVKELEETEAVEELDEPIVLGDIATEDDSPPAAAAAGRREVLSRDDIAYLASKIEFSPDQEPESPEDEQIEDLEIVSPFAGMHFDFSNDDKNAITKSGVDDEKSDIEIIEVLEGVPYINEEALGKKSKPANPLNPQFKDLVDSVIK